jgi:mRNA interferase HigB
MNLSLPRFAGEGQVGNGMVLGERADFRPPGAGFSIDSHLSKLLIWGMRVITRPPLKAFSVKYPEAQSWLEGWWTIAKQAKWKHLGDVRQTYNATDVFSGCTIFDVRGNHFRLITHIDYTSQMIFIRAILTHQEYDRGGWKHDC